jgi:hypothetical protein
MKRIPAMAVKQPQRSSMRCALAWLLMLAVLFGQGLGAVHSISHGVPGAVGHAHAQGPVQTHAQALPVQHAHGPACDHGHGPGLQSLFDHAPDEPGCRLYDQLLQAGPLMPVATVLAAPVRDRPLPAPDTGVQLAAPAAVYQARGPPRA